MREEIISLINSLNDEQLVFVIAIIRRLIGRK